MIKGFTYSDGSPSPLSNSWLIDIEHDGVLFESAEHLFQWLRCGDAEQRDRIRLAETPASARVLGRTATVREDWDATTKADAMRLVLALKFAVGSVLGDWLAATGDEELINTSWDGDVLWGRQCGQGANWLGVLLMERRAELTPKSEHAKVAV